MSEARPRSCLRSVRLDPIFAAPGCTLFLSEDMANGFAWRGTVVINPFAASVDERLSRLLA